MDPKSISTSELKARCSAVIEHVAREREAIVITRHGRPIARIVPVVEERETLFGFARGTITIHGDLIDPVDQEWEAET